MLDTAGNWIEIRLLSLGASLEFRNVAEGTADLYSADESIGPTESLRLTSETHVPIEDGQTVRLAACVNGGPHTRRQPAFELWQGHDRVGALFYKDERGDQLWSWRGGHPDIDVCLDTEDGPCLSVLCVGDGSEVFANCSDEVAVTAL